MNSSEKTKKIIDKALELSKAKLSSPEKDLVEYISYLVKVQENEKVENNDI